MSEIDLEDTVLCASGPEIWSWILSEGRRSHIHVSRPRVPISCLEFLSSDSFVWSSFHDSNLRICPFSAFATTRNQTTPSSGNPQNTRVVRTYHSKPIQFLKRLDLGVEGASSDRVFPIVTCSEDSTMRLWYDLGSSTDQDTSPKSTVFRGHIGWVWEVDQIDVVPDCPEEGEAFVTQHPPPEDARLDVGLVSCGADSCIRVWGESGEELLCLSDSKANGLNCVCSVWERVRQQGSRPNRGRSNGVISGGVDRTVKWWDLETGSIRSVVGQHQSEVRCLLGWDAKCVISGSQDSSLRMFDLASSTLIREFKWHGSMVERAVRLHGVYFASCSADHTCKVWDVRSGKMLRSLKHRGEVHSCLFLGSSGMHSGIGGVSREEVEECIELVQEEELGCSVCTLVLAEDRVRIPRWVLVSSERYPSSVSEIVISNVRSVDSDALVRLIYGLQPLLTLGDYVPLYAVFKALGLVRHVGAICCLVSSTVVSVADIIQLLKECVVTLEEVEPESPGCDLASSEIECEFKSGLTLWLLMKLVQRWGPVSTSHSEWRSLLRTHPVLDCLEGDASIRLGMHPDFASNPSFRTISFSDLFNLLCGRLYDERLESSCSVKLTVSEGSSVFAHKEILIMRSPFFMKFFRFRRIAGVCSSFSEENCEGCEVEEVEIENLSSSELEEIVRYAYTRSLTANLPFSTLVLLYEHCCMYFCSLLKNELKVLLSAALSTAMEQHLIEDLLQTEGAWLLRLPEIELEALAILWLRDLNLDVHEVLDQFVDEEEKSGGEM